MAVNPTPEAHLRTHLAWRCLLVTPTAAEDEALIQKATQAGLAREALPLLLNLRRLLPPDSPLLQTRILYTHWGIKALQNLILHNNT